MTVDKKWKIQPFRRLSNYLQEERVILSIEIQGFTTATALPDLLEALAEYDEATNKNEGSTVSQEQFTEVVDRAEFAAKEVERGFPALHAHALVGIWAAFEVWMDDFLVSCLVNEPSVLSQPNVRKLKLPLAEFESLEQYERMELLLEGLKQQSNLTRKPLVIQFEELAKTIGLRLCTDSDVKRVLLEMGHVRNLIVHSRSVVDKRFIENCPWLDASAGTKLEVSSDDYWNYSKAVTDYTLNVFYKTVEHFDPDSFEELQARLHTNS